MPLLYSTVEPRPHPFDLHTWWMCAVPGPVQCWWPHGELRGGAGWHGPLPVQTCKSGWTNHIYTNNNSTRLQSARWACKLTTWLTRPLSWRQLTAINQSSFMQGAFKVLSVKASSPASLFAIEAHDQCVTFII